MASKRQDKALTHALEDYLETIQQFVDDKGFARVRDICEARGVKSGSASPAVKRLSEMGLIHHQQGEFITLTEKGEAIARRTQARHDLLVRFFNKFLRVDGRQAEKDACAIEHHLSDASMDQLTRLFEFLQNCPEGHGDFLDRFHDCPVVNSDKHACDHRCKKDKQDKRSVEKGRALSDLDIGEQSHIIRVDAEGESRYKLLNIGFIPGAIVELDRKDKDIRMFLNNHFVRLDLEEADAIIVE